MSLTPLDQHGWLDVEALMAQLAEAQETIGVHADVLAETIHKHEQQLAVKDPRLAALVLASQQLLLAWEQKTPLAWQPENNPILLRNLKAALAQWVEP